MKRLAIVMIFLTTACMPMERIAWDKIHNYPEGTTNHFICENNPKDRYCDSTLTEHDILWQAINDTFPASEWHTARRIATCESGLGGDFKTIDIRAVSRSGDHGAFQINARTWNKPNHSDPTARYIGQNWNRVYEPEMNVRMAYRIWRINGWRSWSCF